MITESVAQEQQWARFCAMHERLVLWGQVLLQSAKGDRPTNPEDDRPPLPKVYFDATDESEAWATDTLVRQAAPREQAILRTFYKAREAAHWVELEPKRQDEICDELCREFNDRWRIYCAQVQILPVTLRGYHFGPLRIKAVQLLYMPTTEIGIDNQYYAAENAPDTCLGTCAP